jgi:hypothetical protein
MYGNTVDSSFSNIPSAKQVSDYIYNICQEMPMMQVFWGIFPLTTRIAPLVRLQPRKITEFQIASYSTHTPNYVLHFLLIYKIRHRYARNGSMQAI